MKKEDSKTKKMVATAMLFSLAIVLSMVENMITAPIPIPGIKFGLSNIVVMYAMFFLNKKDAFTIAVLKGIFSAMTRGVIAGILSLTGGLFSLVIILLLMFLLKEKGSYFLYSVFGAIFHNIGQFVAVSILYTSMAWIYYFPLLLVTAIVAGTVTSGLLKVTLPVLQKL